MAAVPSRSSYQSNDEEDVGLLSLSCIIDRIVAMKNQEVSIYSYENHCQSKDCREKDGEKMALMEPSWREQICEWSYGVVDYFDLSREMVAISMSLIDRFLAKSEGQESGSSSKRVLLATMATLQLAIKINEHKKLHLKSYCLLSRGNFSPKQVEDMEKEVLEVLDWKVNPPTALEFIGHLLLLLPREVHASINEMYTFARYLSELCIHDVFFINVDASLLAVAAILVAMEKPNDVLVPVWARETFSSTLNEKIQMDSQSPKIKKVCQRIQQIYEASENASNEEDKQHTQGENTHKEHEDGPRRSPTTVLSAGEDSDFSCHPSKRRALSLS